MAAPVRIPRYLVVALLGAWLPAAAQTPRPAPPPPPATAAPSTASPPGGAPQGPGTPSESELGVPIFPNAVYLGGYDAGRGQRFHLFGLQASFTEAVGFYRTALKTKGDVVFDAPPTHIFETGRFRQETMAFPPSVTVKDYTSGGSGGFPNPQRGAAPDRFPTILQIVAVPSGAGGE